MEEEYRVGRGPVSITSLPNELLSYVFELAVTDPQQPRSAGECRTATKTVQGILIEAREATTLSLVCRCFRSVALATPRLWVSLLDVQPPDVIEQRLARCGGRPLDIVMAFRNHSSDEMAASPDPDTLSLQFANFVDSILPLANCWRSFAVDRDFGYDIQIARGALEYLRTKSMGLVCPALQCIRLNLAGMVGEDNMDDNDDDYAEYYGSWKMPLLRSVQIGDHIPLTSLPAIKICNFTFTGYSNCQYTGEEAVELLFEFADDLEELTIMHIDRIPFTRRGDFEPCPFPSLRKLSINGGFTMNKTFQRFLGDLELPMLQELCFVVSHADDVDATGELAEISLSLCMLEASTWPSLTKLQLSLDRAVSGANFSLVEVVFRYLKHLKHLVLEDFIGHSPATQSDCWQGMAKLATLSLNNCLNYDSAFLREMIATRKAVGSFEQLKLVAVTGFTKISEEEMLSLLPPHKYRWVGAGRARR